MATKRRKLHARPIGISAAAAAAWQAGDFHGLAAALGVKPWQPHPWPLEVSALGCTQGAWPADLWGPEDWTRAQALQRALLEVAGPAPERVA